MILRKRTLIWGLLPLCLLALPACQQQMADQPYYKPLEPSSFFLDGRSARPVVPGTVARGQLQSDTQLYDGKTGGGEWVDIFPFEMDEYVLERGKQRFTIFCSVCHGMTGTGDGRIVQRGFTKPPNLNTDNSRFYRLKDKDISLREIQVGYIYNVITHGFGAMPEYSSQIPVKDRWAIVGYVRALQLSQASPAERQKMEASWLQALKGEKK